MDTTWAICWNGPAQGTVCEVPVNRGYLRVCETAYDGTHVYLRTRWGDGPGHYIAIFEFSRTLVV